ncbi:hypothetical protein [Paracoccus rhizosphaerae]|uniref:Helix-turn-helix domain-containing protein n=2 Tax=Paracoccus rhizosphaerae TaxID=1133347 RepID=A0ABV6CQG1_9RHOB|nr:hypothetical protein [Paracoccus rhizosphaerae]
MAEVLAQAARLLAQSAQATDLAKRYQAAGLAMLAGVCGSGPAIDASAGIRRISAFRTACTERGIRMTGDDHIGEAGAADLLAVARSTLAMWRQEGRLPYRRNPSGQIQYSLATLAEFVGSFPTD